MSLYFPQLRTLQQSIAFHAAERPDHPAVLCEDRSVSYGDLHRRSNRTAHGLRAQGLAAGARVAFLGKESEHYYDVLFGAAKAGAVLVPINWRLTPGEVRHILADSGTAVLFVEDEFLPAAERVVAELAQAPVIVRLDGPGGPGTGLPDWQSGFPDTGIDAGGGWDDPVAQLYTSGTTGLPKGVVLAQRSFFAVRDAMESQGLDWIDLRPGDVSLIGIPGFHVGGIWWAAQGFNAGVTIVSMRMFVSATAVDLIRDAGVTIACVVPAMLQMMLSEQRATRAHFASLRKVVYGGSPISATLLQQCLDDIGCEFAQIYGLTETGNTAVCLPPAEHVAGSPRLQAAGRPYPGIDIKVIDSEGRALPPRAIGEICIRTPAAMLEYWGLPEATASTLVDGWVHTGDAGYLDEEGFVFVCDRIKDTVIVAGENVYPAEIESALAKHPAVAEAAVVGIPHEQWGEAVHAFVVFRAGRTARPRELMLFLRDEIADFKVPTSYDVIPALPRNPSGKILRRSLRDRFWAGRVRQVN